MNKIIIFFSILFLISSVFIAFDIQASVSAASRAEILNALAVLTPIENQSIEEAYLFIMDAYNATEFKHASLRKEGQDRKRLKKAYKVLRGYGLQHATKADIERLLNDQQSLLLQRSFQNQDMLARTRTVAAELDMQRANDEDELSPTQAQQEVRKPQETQNSSGHVAAPIRFRDIDHALQYLGLRWHPNLRFDDVEVKILLIRLDAELGTVSDEQLALAELAFAYLKDQQG